MILYLNIFIIIFILLVLYYLFNIIERFDNIKETPIFIISLERATDRREKIVETLKDEQKYKIINAVDGKNMSPEDIALKDKYIKTDLNPGQIGCFLSHLKLWHYIIDNNIPDAVILEDDIVKLFNINTIIDLIHNSQNLKNFDIIYIGHEYEKQNEPRIKVEEIYEESLQDEYIYNPDNTKIHPDKKIVFYKSTIPYGTHAYIITKSGAQKLLDYIDSRPESKAIDVEMTFAIKDNKINAYSMYPTLVNQDGSPSYIVNS